LALKRILVIDDDSTLIESLSAALSPPYCVSGASTKASVLAYLETDRTDLIILDLVLGPEDGVELLPHLRRRTPAPILVITGFGTRENLLRLMWVRPDGILEKPIAVQPLRARVAVFLEQGPSEPDPLERVRAWIASECHRPLTVTDLARAAGMSPANFWRTFVKRFALTPRAYLRQCRMERAAMFLQVRKDLIKELAPDVGVINASNFSRVFKRVHGCTPEAFRKEGHQCSPKKTD